MAARNSLNTSSHNSPVFDYSVDPDSKNWLQYAQSNAIAPASNFFWYHQLGDVVFVSYSGAHTWEDQKAYFDEACSFVDSVRQSVNWVVLLSHWDYSLSLASLSWTGKYLDTPKAFLLMTMKTCGAFKDFYD